MRVRIRDAVRVAILVTASVLSSAGVAQAHMIAGQSADNPAHVTRLADCVTDCGDITDLGWIPETLAPEYDCTAVRCCCPCACPCPPPTPAVFSHLAPPMARPHDSPPPDSPKRHTVLVQKSTYSDAAPDAPELPTTGAPVADLLGLALAALAAGAAALVLGQRLGSAHGRHGLLPMPRHRHRRDAEA